MRLKPFLLCFALALSACGASTTSSQPTSVPAPATAYPTVAAHEEAVLEQPTQLPTAAASATTATITTAVPTSTPIVKHSVQRIVIDDIRLDEATVPVGLDQNRVPIVPQHEVGWYTLSAGPGENENIVLWGHVLRFKATPNIPAPFGRVKELKPGARITLYDETNTAHTYAITEQVQATPEEVKYILPTGGEQLTLVSCIGEKVRTEVGVEMTHRLITIAKPVE